MISGTVSECRSFLMSFTLSASLGWTPKSLVILSLALACRQLVACPRMYSPDEIRAYIQPIFYQRKLTPITGPC